MTTQKKQTYVQSVEIQRHTTLDKDKCQEFLELQLAALMNTDTFE